MLDNKRLIRRKLVYPFVVVATFSFFLNACSSKVTSPNLTKLENREAVLALNTQLNNLKLELEREKLNISGLEK